MRDDDDPREGQHIDGSTAHARRRLRQELGINVGTEVCGWTLERIHQQQTNRIASRAPLPFKPAEPITLK
jgi:hypothetical protein